MTTKEKKTWKFIRIGGPNLAEHQHTYCIYKAKSGSEKMLRLPYGAEHPIEDVPNHKHLTSTGRAEYFDK